MTLKTLGITPKLTNGAHLERTHRENKGGKLAFITLRRRPILNK